MSDADCTPGREPRSIAASSLLSVDTLDNFWPTTCARIKSSHGHTHTHTQTCLIFFCEAATFTRTVIVLQWTELGTWQFHLYCAKNGAYEIGCLEILMWFAVVMQQVWDDFWVMYLSITLQFVCIAASWMVGVILFRVGWPPLVNCHFHGRPA